MPPDYVPEDPFKKGPPSSLRELPHANSSATAIVDPAHTWAIVGIGKDLYGSAIVLGAKLGLFGNGSMELNLQNAYDKFQAFLVRTGKYSSVVDFSHKTLKCGKSHLAYNGNTASSSFVNKTLSMEAPGIEPSLFS